MHVRPLRACVLALVLLTACGTPPHKEMDQAQGAIDAARAAGADRAAGTDRYAVDEYNAAVQSLRLANDAVDQRDYRLALSHALESREHAQNAARGAAAARARLRGEIERTTAEIKALLAQAQGRLGNAEKSKVARRTINNARTSIASANSGLQKAGAAMEREDYEAAQTALASAKNVLTDTIATLDAALDGLSTKRRR